MKEVQVTLKFVANEKTTMSWERIAGGKGAAFDLLGRAFEAAERETGESVSDSLLAFFHGALLRKADIASVLDRME